MVDRERLAIFGVLVLACGASFIVGLPRRGASPAEFHTPVVDPADAARLRCDGEGTAAGPRVWLVGEPLDVNQATAADLRRLPHVGERVANAMVADREANGAFDDVDALLRVKGFGRKTLDRIRPLIIAKPRP